MQGVNFQTIELYTETLFEANILSETLLSQPYTQVKGSILTCICLNIPQMTPKWGSKLLFWAAFCIFGAFLHLWVVLGELVSYKITRGIREDL